MTNKPTTSTFNFNALIEGVQCSHSVRAVTLEGNPWFVATDVLAALGAKLAGGTGPYLRIINGDERRLIAKRDYLDLFKGDRAPTLTIITESALYKLVMRSDKPQGPQLGCVVLGTPPHDADAPALREGPLPAHRTLR